MEIICVPAIVSITYALIEAYKKWVAKGREKWLAFVPLIALIIGGVLGVVIFYIAPQIIIANSWYMALIVGLCSGLSATGTNQVFKQLKKVGVKVKEVESLEASKEETAEENAIEEETKTDDK